MASNAPHRWNIVLALVAGIAIGSNPEFRPLGWLREVLVEQPVPQPLAQGPASPEAASATAKSAAGGRPAARTSELDVLRRAELELFPEILGSATDTDVMLRASVGRVLLPSRGDLLADLAEPDIPIPRESEVLTYLRFFTETQAGRRLVERWLARRARYGDVVEGALEKQGLPRALEAIVMVESGYHPRARSEAGAVGLWQLMPATARRYGLKIEPKFDERREPGRASRAAAKHLAWLRERFDSWELVLAAYNAGARRIEENAARTRADDYWALSRAPGGLPRETILYVPKVLALAVVLENLDTLAFGVPVDDAPPPDNGRLVLLPASAPEPANGDLALTLLSGPAGTPWMSADAAPDSHAIVIARPSGMDDWDSAAMDSALDALSSGRLQDERARPMASGEDEPWARPYRVQPGDTLSRIALHFGVSMKSVMEQNHMKDSSLVRIGQRLRIPVASGSAVSTSPPSNVTVYYASTGDTVSSIAQAFGVSERQVVLDNDLKNPEFVREGQILRLNVAPRRAKAYLRERTP